MGEKVGPEVVLGRLKRAVRSVVLCTVDESGVPHSGYTPFMFDGKDIVVFVSQLSLHTRDLLATRQAAAMLIADEADSAQIFARTRVSYQCEAVVVGRDSDEYEDLLTRFEQVHGKTVALLRSLPDFVLFRLQPCSGQFVMGFGQAYRLTGDLLDTFEHATSA